MELYLSFIAAVPFLIVIYLMIFKKKSALFSLIITYLISLLILLFIWKISINSVFASLLKAIFLSSEIMLIIFGAIVLLSIFNESGKIKVINNILSNISRDQRIQAIIIAWFFVSFIEGVAGFGTPVALAAPLLVSLGFNPIGAVILSLIGDSSAVSFGAAGTPIILGLESLTLSSQDIYGISIYTSLFHLLIGTFIPLVLVYFVVFVISPKKQDSIRFYEMIPFALMSGLLFTIPSLIVVLFLSHEIPSIVASLFGFLIIFFMIKYNILVPKSTLSKKEEKKFRKVSLKNSLFVFSPYIVLISLLFFTRVLYFVKDYLKGIDISYNNILGSGINYVFLPFFTPSLFFFLAIIYGLLIFKLNLSSLKKIFSDSINRMEKPFISLIFALAFVQLLIISGNNFSGLPSLPLILASSITDFTGKFFIILSPLVGVLGAFITGSNTVSNILFSALQNEAAISIGASTIIILSLQVVGGAVGNMIAIHNILAAEATVRLHGKEGEIIRKTIVIALFYAIFAGIAGFVIHLINR